jgi:hypothetical protein
MTEYILENKAKKKASELAGKARQALKDRLKREIEDAPGKIVDAGTNAIKNAIIRGFKGLKNK